MDEIKKFIIDNQNSLSPTTNIIISIGIFSENNTILNCQMKEPIIKNLLQTLTQRQIKYESFNTRIYKENDMEYSIDGNGENNKRHQYHNISNIIINNIGFRAKLVELTNKRIEEFPCKLRYCDEFSRSTIVVHYNSLFDIHIITEQRDKPIIKLEIHIVRQNIYTNKL